MVSALARYHRLESLCTDFYDSGSGTNWLNRVLTTSASDKALQALRTRRAPTDRPITAHTHAWFGVRNRMRVRAAIRAGRAHEAYLRGGTEFARLAARLPWKHVDAVYGFSSACLELFQAAKARGVRCVLDHETAPAAAEAALVHEVESHYEDWLPYRHNEKPPGLAAYADRQQAEAELADVVLCPSTFSLRLTRETGVGNERLRCLPFAVADTFICPDLCERSRSEPLRVLFAGHDAIRKGLPVLVEALKKLPAGTVEARGLGDWNLSPQGWANCAGVIDHRGAVPRSEMAQQYQWADVFVLPTYSDTMGAVILEAMSSGVPVLATENSGGPDLIRDRVDGGLVRLGSSDDLADWFVRWRDDRDLLASMSEAAREGARSHGFDHYRDDLCDIIDDVCEASSTPGTNR